MKTDALPKSLI